MRLEAHNDSLPHLFEDVAQQLFSQLINPQDVGAALREKVAVEGESLEQLLQEWVTALLDLVKFQHMLFGQFKVTELKTIEKGPYSLRAEAVGELMDPQRHTLKHNPASFKCAETPLMKDTGGYHVEISLRTD